MSTFGMLCTDLEQMTVNTDLGVRSVKLCPRIAVFIRSVTALLIALAGATEFMAFGIADL